MFIIVLTTVTIIVAIVIIIITTTNSIITMKYSHTDNTAIKTKTRLWIL